MRSSARRSARSATGGKRARSRRHLRPQRARHRRDGRRPPRGRRNGGHRSMRTRAPARRRTKTTARRPTPPRARPPAPAGPKPTANENPPPLRYQRMASCAKPLAAKHAKRDSSARRRRPGRGSAGRGVAGRSSRVGRRRPRRSVSPAPPRRRFPLFRRRKPDVGAYTRSLSIPPATRFHRLARSPGAARDSFVKCGARRSPKANAATAALTSGGRASRTARTCARSGSSRGQARIGSGTPRGAQLPGERERGSPPSGANEAKAKAKAAGAGRRRDRRRDVVRDERFGLGWGGRGG